MAQAFRSAFEICAISWPKFISSGDTGEGVAIGRHRGRYGKHEFAGRLPVRCQCVFNSDLSQRWNGQRDDREQDRFHNEHLAD